MMPLAGVVVDTKENIMRVLAVNHKGWSIQFYGQGKWQPALLDLFIDREEADKTCESMQEQFNTRFGVNAIQLRVYEALKGTYE